MGETTNQGRMISPDNINGKRRFYAIIALILGVLAISFATRCLPQNVTQHLSARLGGEVLVLEIADTDALRKQGLSGREGLKSNEGMFFVFPKDDAYGFWMKDMRFPIDIVWLDDGYRIVDMRERVQPESYPEVFRPNVSARYTVEFPSGFFAKHGLAKGMSLEILR